MKVYCFNKPTDPGQRLAIRAIGSMENEVQANFIKMSDADKLATTKLNVVDAEKRGVVGLFWVFLCVFRLGYEDGDWQNPRLAEVW